MSTNRIARHCLVLLAAITALLLGAGPASAHVTAHVYGAQLEKGGEGAILLRVPNEETEKNTVRIEVTIPSRYDITRVRTSPVAGWSAEISRGAGGTVTAITWTAAPAAEIPPGDEHYAEFSFTASPLPADVDSLVLPTKQVYGDGSLTDWAEEQTGDAEPAHPAPTVALAEASAAGHGHHGAKVPAGLPDWTTIAVVGTALILVVLIGVVFLFRPRRRSQP